MDTYLEVEFTVVLVRRDGQGGESDERAFTYYFAVPESWSYLVDDELQLRAFDVAERMYAQLNERLRAAEPTRPNDLRVKATRARLLSSAEVAAAPWRQSTATPPWERSPCITVAPDGSFRRTG
jgi:hypothetical protein